MTVYEKKAAFVANELTALIRKIDDGVHRAEYKIRNDGEEFVCVYDTAGRTIISICVSADSLAAITRDVIKAVE